MNKTFSVIIKTLCALVAMSLILAVAGISLIMYFNSPPQTGIRYIETERDGIRITEDGECFIEVRRGESSQSVGLRLERTGVIRNRYFWNLINRMETGLVKTGTYKIELPSTQLSIHRLLVSGKQLLLRVTIPEGVTLTKMARVLEDAGICKAEDFLQIAKDPDTPAMYGIPNKTMEGYLFPDTYLFPSDYPASQVIRAMKENFLKKIAVINPQITTMDASQLNEKVILASIIEREYRVAEEAPVIAGVFANRLRINMALQSCATVEYIITEIQGKPHPTHIYNQDLEIRDPYNTYQRPGLPPGPISAPGAVALRAAFFPENTEYLYFRVEDVSAGRHYFSKTLDEHIRAGQFVLKPQS
jgi:UPF0755 protein